MTAHQRLKAQLEAGQIPSAIAGDLRALLSDHASHLARLKKCETQRANLHRAQQTTRARDPRNVQGDGSPSQDSNEATE